MRLRKTLSARAFSRVRSPTLRRSRRQSVPTQIRSRWGRLLSEDDAAEYLAISRTTLRELEIASRRIGRRVLYDIRELDRFVDRMEGAAPAVQADDREAAAAEQERRFFEQRGKRRGAN